MRVRFIGPALLAAAALLSGCGGGGGADASGSAKTDAAEAPASVSALAIPAKAAAAVAGNVVGNFGFESGVSPWMVASSVGSAVIFDQNFFIAANTGTRLASLGGVNSVTETLSQTVTVPINTPLAKLQFWYRVTTAETSTATMFDTLKVELYDPISDTKLVTLDTFSNLDAANPPRPWQRSPLYDLSAYRGQSVRVKFTYVGDSTQTTTFLIDDVAVAPLDVAGILPQTGWWWNANESGRGFAIERQGDKIFMAAFLYETSGVATWYTATMDRQASGMYTGALVRNSGGQTLLGTYKAPNATTPGSAALTFTAANAATLTLRPDSGGDEHAVALERFGFGTPAFAASDGNFQNGWWWNESESGRGYFIEAQGSQIFSASFMYEVSGQPVWYTESPSLTSVATFSGALQQYKTGQSLFGVYRAPVSQPADLGNLGFEATSATTGNVVLPDGRKLPIKRFVFN